MPSDLFCKQCPIKKEDWYCTLYCDPHLITATKILITDKRNRGLLSEEEYIKLTLEEL